MPCQKYGVHRSVLVCLAAQKASCTGFGNGFGTRFRIMCCCRLDFRNAYNTVKGAKLLDAIHRLCPWFLAYALTCYGAPVELFGEGGLVVSSAEGEQQGDPCGPLFFAVVIAALSKQLAATPGVWSQWYLDDGHLAGPRALLNDMLPVLEAEAAKLGLVLNRSKCAVLAPVFAADLPETMFPGIPRVSGSECLPVLGSPVGASKPCKAWEGSNHWVTPGRPH